MSRNIKEIGKELMGKSLNSFHRKTGLTQLEKNNEMQDGILDGILSQVDDAYIEKTEQSNIIHLDGSGDGVVVLDSIEGNTMVNLIGEHTFLNYATYNSNDDSFIINQTDANKAKICFSNALVQPSKTYTVQFNIVKNTLVNSNESSDRCAKFNIVSYNVGTYMIETGTVGIVKVVLHQPSAITHDGKPYFETFSTTTGEMIIKDFVILEGDWSNREIPNFKGLQSSFEEQIEGDKYKIEILSKNKNLFNGKMYPIDINIDTGAEFSSSTACSSDFIPINPKYLYSYKRFGAINNHIVLRCYDSDKNYLGTTITDNTKYIKLRCINNGEDIASIQNNIVFKEGDMPYAYIEPKSNKIKILIDEPLRAVGNTKDRLRIKDGKLVVERKCGEVVLIGDNIFKQIGAVTEYENTVNFSIFINASETIRIKSSSVCLCDRILPHTYVSNENEFEHIRVDGSVPYGNLKIWLDKSKLSIINKESIKQWLSNNLTTVVYQLAEPYYEEVLNEYGEPIILEGYENGTLYIDSIITPTTTVRYTPKMESLNVLSEVANDNVVLTSDINDIIVPYMMEVDLMIMEKEMASTSQLNTRKVGMKIMTDMQKRTKHMLERLIKGKTLTKEDAKTRVTTYLSAEKITDEQAEELMLLIEEVYA